MKNAPSPVDSKATLAELAPVPHDSLSGTPDDVSTAVIKGSENIAEAIQNSLNSGFMDTLYIALIAALVGAFAAFLFSLLYWRIVRRRTALAGAAQAMAGVVEKLEEAGRRYWLSQSKDQTTADRSELEFRVKSYMKLVIRYARIISESRRRGRERDVIESINKFSDEVFEIATGSDFESADREPSTSNAQRLTSKCSEVQGSLLQLQTIL